MSARDKIAAQQASVRQSEQRRRVLIAAASVTAVIAVVIALIVVRSLSGTNSGSSAGVSSASTVAATVGKDIANVPQTTLDKVGAGLAYPAKGGVYPHAIQAVSPAVSILKNDGKPQVAYVGAEYCPYCAAERWALAVALSRFGSFSGVGLIHSKGGAEAYPLTPTLTFYKSAYTSKYVTFSPTEAATVTEQPLQTMTTLDKALMSKYDAPPYVPSNASGSFPFVDFGNQYVIAGASYDPATLAGLTWAQIGADLANPSSAAGEAIDGTANRMTAAICALTGNQPGAVCTSKAVTSASGSI
ncbi:MAG: DUF929 family protein [Streptosporangiaceae bacterium]